jgi:hypothetical protein
LYANATKVRSSRAIECHFRQDVAYRVITGNVVPDHATVARFVVRHERALADLFGEVLRLCDQAGLVKPELIAIDGTRMAWNVSQEASRDFTQIAMEMLAEHKATDEAEGEQLGEARGDELPEQLRTPESRREFFRKARHKQRGEAGTEVSANAEPEVSEPQVSEASEPEVSEPQVSEASEPEVSEPEASCEPEYEFDAERIIARSQGRKGWLRDAERQLEQHRWQNPGPIPRSRADRLLLAAERAGNEAEHHRVHGRDAQGRRLAGTPAPYQPPEIPAGKAAGA